MRRRRNPRDRLPLSQLTHDQIVELSLDDFSKAEWKDELSEDERQQILDNTPDDKLEPHIRAFQRAIDRWYIYAQHADFDDDADRALDDARPDVADQYADNPPFESARLREIAPEIRTRIVDALSAENAWDRLTDDDHEEPDWTYAVGYTNLYVPHDDAIELQDLLSVVPEDAAQGVLDRAESETDICLFADPQEIRDIDTRHDVEIPYHSPREVRYKIDWDWVEVFLLEDDAVIEAMTQDFELTGLPADRRIVHRFADGGVALTLDSSDELEEEGEILDHCVGDPQHGWPQKLANRDIVIISMRPYANATKFEGGKRKLINTPWFTIAVGLYGAEPTEVLQINGYHNRPLGFPKFKQFAGE